MIGKPRRYIFLVVLGLFVMIAAISPKGSPASASQKSVVVEFVFRGRFWSITGENTAPNTYVFNKGAPGKIRMATLDWAPYIGETICKQGWVQQLTIALLASKGYEITTSFMPWARTIRMAETGAVDILYPEYFIEPSAVSDVHKGTNRLEHLALSRKLPGGPIAFMKRRGEVDVYKGDLFNLKNEKIGVVRGYQNTPAFDGLMGNGLFEISESVDDLMNTKKLISRRINLIIGDPAVIRFNIANSVLNPGEQSGILEKIEVVQPVIQYNHLYYAVSRKNPSWETTLRVLNAAIAEFEKSGLMFEIIKQVNTSCGYHMDQVLSPYE